MKSSDLWRMPKSDGWYEIRQKGSHKILRHPSKSGELVFPFHGSQEGSQGLWKAILKQAGIK